MRLDRRQFLLAAVAIAAGCDPQDQTPESPRAQPATAAASVGASPADEQAVDAGSLDDFPNDGVYDTFRDRGFFVVRRDKKLFALSSVCTHKGCKVRSAPDASFHCRCHGSRFDPDGKVLKGPARRDLPRVAVATWDNGQVLVNLAQQLPATRTAVDHGRASSE